MAGLKSYPEIASTFRKGWDGREVSKAFVTFSDESLNRKAKSLKINGLKITVSLK